MSYVMVDIEADGPIPGDFSMVCFGAVIVEAELGRTFYATLAPVSDTRVAPRGSFRGVCHVAHDIRRALSDRRRSLSGGLPEQLANALGRAGIAGRGGQAGRSQRAFRRLQLRKRFQQRVQAGDGCIAQGLPEQRTVRQSFGTTALGSWERTVRVNMALLP